MLAKIKSKIILKKIFFNMKEVQKYRLINYNKNLQNMIEISLIDYRKFSGKYIIHDEYGEVKEFNSYNDQLIYEGEYLNGKRNGKGKEYDSNGILCFEGEFVNGKRWKGKGKEYYDNGNIIFEGEYLNGEIDGYGKEYDYDGKLYFEGEYLNGKRNGKGKEYDSNGKLYFEGEYFKGERVGKGKEYNNYGIFT